MADDGFDIPAPTADDGFDLTAPLSEQEQVADRAADSFATKAALDKYPVAKVLPRVDPSAYSGRSAAYAHQQNATADAQKPEDPAITEARHAYYLEVKAKALPKARAASQKQLVAAGRGVARGGTIGFGDEWAGLWGGLGAKSVGGDFGSNYVDARDEARIADEVASSANPWTFGLSELGGGMLVPVPGAAGLKAAKTAGEAVKAGAKGGAVLGAAAGLGYSDADLTKGDLSSAIQDTLAGATVGTALGGTAAAASKKVEAYLLAKAEKAQKAAQRDALRAGAGGSAKSVTQSLNSTQDGLAEQVGQHMLENLSLRKLPSDLADDVNAQLSKTGAQLESLAASVTPDNYPSLVSVFGDEAKSIIQRLRQHGFGAEAAEQLESRLREAVSKNLPRDQIRVAVLDAIEGEIQRIHPPGTVGPRTAIADQLETAWGNLTENLAGVTRSGPRDLKRASRTYSDLIHGESTTSALPLSKRLELIGEHWQPMDTMKIDAINVSVPGSPSMPLFTVSPELKNALNGYITHLLPHFPEELGAGLRELGESGISAQSLWKLRQQVDDVVYGVSGSSDPNRNMVVKSLHEFRTLLNRAIGEAVQSSNPTAASDIWNKVSHGYSMGKFLQSEVLPKGIGSEQNLTLGPRAFGGGSLGSAILGTTGYAVGGPVGAAVGTAAGSVLGAGTGVLHKRYGAAVSARLNEATAKGYRATAAAVPSGTPAVPGFPLIMRTLNPEEAKDKFKQGKPVTSYDPQAR